MRIGFDDVASIPASRIRSRRPVALAATCVKGTITVEVSMNSMNIISIIMAYICGIGTIATVISGFQVSKLMWVLTPAFAALTYIWILEIVR